MMHGVLRSCGAAALLLLAVTCPQARGQSSAPAPDPLADRLQSIHERVQSDGDFAAAAEASDRVFDQVVAYRPLSDTKAYADAAYARRLFGQLAKAPPAQAKATYAILREHEPLGRTLAYLMRQEDEPASVYDLLNRMHASQPKASEQLPALVAAIGVVHDKPLSRQINENTVRAPDPVELLEFYLRHERRMLFGLKKMPPELLIWVVDATGSVDEMRWALGQYAGNRGVGRLFFTISYDYEHLRSGTAKRVTQAGYNLPNIKRYGGVCADQAYFASAVGKAIGVPTAYVVGRSGEVGHAWVGFLEARRGQAAWNFSTGRYEGYQGIRGIVLDPQTRNTIPDSFVSALSEMIRSPRAQRHASMALVDAAERLNAFIESPDGWTPLPLTGEANGGQAAKRREPGVDAQLEVLRHAVELCPGNIDAWFAVRSLAENGRMTLEHKRAWAGALEKMTGQKYPDFTMDILVPMIRTVDEPAEQHRLWESAFKLMQRRQDLAAEIRVEQGQLWEKQGEPTRAGRCYEDVLRRFPNAGPFVLDALQRTEKMLVEAGYADRALELYQTTWRKIEPPQDMAAQFATQSNWYQVGMLYARQLDTAGRASQAQQVRQEINSRLGVEG